MLVIYLVVSALTTGQKIVPYLSEQQACIDVEAASDGHLYMETIDKHGQAIQVVEGVCKPIKQFVTK